MKPRPTSCRFLLIAVALVVFALTPALAQQTADPDMGRIHGRVINPAGQPEGGGTVSLSTDNGVTYLYDFVVSPTGEYSGQALPAEYTLIYHTASTPEGRAVDFIRGVTVMAGLETKQDVDMSRPEYVNRLTPGQQKGLDVAKASTAAAIQANAIITAVNTDLNVVNQDLQDVATARASAIKNLGAEASRPDIELMAADIEKTKYTEIETLMAKDTAAYPGEPILWMDLGRAQIGLNELEDAEKTYKKALDIANGVAPPQPMLIAAADAGLGAVYAHSLMVDEANAAFDAAAKADPANAAVYLRNQAVIFFYLKNAPAQVDAADEAIKADPRDAILYFIKAQGLALNAPLNPDTNQIVLPADCASAYRKYLELEPTGPYATYVTRVLQKSGLAAGASGGAGKK
jgi:tetratricopeptide (TPR) repeat protein